MGYIQKVVRKRRTSKREIINVSLFVILNLLLFFFLIIFAYNNSGKIVDSLFSELSSKPRLLLNFIKQYGNDSIGKIQNQFDSNNLSCADVMNNSSNRSIIVSFSQKDNKTNKAIASDISQWCLNQTKNYTNPSEIGINFTDVMLKTNLTNVIFGPNSTIVAESKNEIKNQSQKQLRIISTNTSPINYEKLIIILIIVLIGVYAYNNGIAAFLNKLGDSLFSYSLLFMILILIMPWIKSILFNSNSISNIIAGFFLMLYVVSAIVSPYFVVFTIVAISGAFIMVLSENMAKKILIKDFEEKNLFKEIKDEKRKTRPRAKRK